MGKIPIFTDKQEIILKEFANDPFLSSHFYFTGGTALSAFYLQHRESEDIDLFSENKFDYKLLEKKLASGQKNINSASD